MGKAFLTTSSDTAPQKGAGVSAEREQHPLSFPACAIGKAGAVEDEDLENAWFPTPVAWDSFQFPFPVKSYQQQRHVCQCESITATASLKTLIQAFIINTTTRLSSKIDSFPVLVMELYLTKFICFTVC